MVVAAVFVVLSGCSGDPDSTADAPKASTTMTSTTVDQEPGRCVALIQPTGSPSTALDRVSEGVGAETMTGLAATPAAQLDATALWVGNAPIVAFSSEVPLTDTEASAKLERIRQWAEEHPEEGITVIVDPSPGDCVSPTE
jgi:hypothetical protein